MATNYTPPIISVQLNEAEEYQLYATSHSYTAIAGPRLFRGEPCPEIKWRCYTKEEAEREARKLRTYLDECATGKRKDVEVGRGWWED